MIATILIFLLFAAPLFGQESEAIACFPDGASFTCEIADSPIERTIGLSRHETLAPERGMFFIYRQDDWLSFWMPPEMKFNLDIIFLDADFRVIHIACNVPPCDAEHSWDCPSYGPPDRMGRYVLEVLGGTVKDDNLKVGDVVEIRLPKGYRIPKR